MTNYLYQQLFSNIDNCQAENLLFCRFVDTELSDISYSQLEQQVNQLANYLISLGVKPNERVALQINKAIEGVIIYLATIKVGAIFLPLNPDYVLDEISYFIADAQPKVFITSDDKYQQYLSVFADKLNLISLQQIQAIKMPETFEAKARTKDDIAAILYTSGTTGKPKGAMLTHGNLEANVKALTKAWHYSSQDKLIHALPLFHTHGLFVAINLTIYNKASLLFLSKFDAQRIIELLSDATILMGVPTFYTRLLKSARLSAELCQSMRLFISGSAPLLASDHQAFYQATGKAILERYGMTETNMTLSNPYHGERLAGTVGKPLEGVSARICEPDSTTELACGEIGLLQVKGEGIFKGYWQNTEKTQQAFTTDGYFITGDYAKVNEQGYYQIVGRDNDLIISGGLNIYPSEIEQQINQVQGVIESAVVSQPDNDFGEQVCALVVIDDNHTANNVKQAIEEQLAQKLSKFKRPKQLKMTTQLPRNSMGKIQKNLIKQQWQSY